MLSVEAYVGFPKPLLYTTFPFRATKTWAPGNINESNPLCTSLSTSANFPELNPTRSGILYPKRFNELRFTEVLTGKSACDDTGKTPLALIAPKISWAVFCCAKTLF